MGVIFWGKRLLSHLAPGLGKPESVVKGLETLDAASTMFAYDADQARPAPTRSHRAPPSCSQHPAASSLSPPPRYDSLTPTIRDSRRRSTASRVCSATLTATP